MSLPRVRWAAPADLNQILLMERESGTAPHWPELEYKSILENGAQQRAEGSLRRCLFVAGSADSAVAGFAVGRVLGWAPEVEAELESVVVRPEAREQGLGRLLCLAVMDWSREQGALEIALEVRSKSAGPMHLYRGLGFLEVGRRPDYYAAPGDDAVAMTCRL